MKNYCIKYIFRNEIKNNDLSKLNKHEELIKRLEKEYKNIKNENKLLEIIEILKSTLNKILEFNKEKNEIKKEPIIQNPNIIINNEKKILIQKLYI